MKCRLIFSGCLSWIFAAAAAQPDYTNAVWRSAAAGHWYTTGSARAFVVEHDMEGYYLSTVSFFQQSGTQASIHFCVNGLQNGNDSSGHHENEPNDSAPGEITQMVEEQNWAWHARCWNRFMFGTEHEGFVSNPIWYTEAMYQASGQLTRYLCDKYNIPKDRNHIIGHNEHLNPAWRAWMTNNWPQIDPTCNNHTDPGQFWDWNHFMAIVGATAGPVITNQPWSRLVEPGTATGFTVAASGNGTLNYQWRKDSVPLPGATDSAYVIPNAQPASAGSYSVAITNVEGAITSRVATLTISPVWLRAFADDFETNSAANWDLFWGAGNGVADYTTNWAFDYSTTKYVAKGVTNFIPAAPSSGGVTHGLKLTVNKNDTNAATAGVSLYPRNQTFSNDFVLRFDMWINYNGGAGGGSGSTEYASFGLNHSGTEANWTTAAPASDGLWFAVDGEGGSGGSDYRAFVGNGAAAATQLSYAESGLAASGAGSDNVGDSFYRSLFSSSSYETAGAPGKHWIAGEVSQIGNLITWQLNGVVIAQRTNTSSYIAGKPMLGYFDPYTSIANPLADNFVLFDNVRVLVSAAGGLFNNVHVTPRPSSAFIAWTGSPAARSRIEYGPLPGYGWFSPLESIPATNHTLLLTGLVPGTIYAYRIHSLVNGNDVASLPATFSTDLNLIVDNPQAVYSGLWTLGTSSTDKYGDYYQYAQTTPGGVSTALATYTPNIPTAAKYDVSIWYPEGANRSTATPVTVYYNGGTVSAHINQTSGGGNWRLLGSNLDFAAGTDAFAVVGNNTGESGKVVMADALRWSYASSQDSGANGSVPAWWRDYYFVGAVNAALDPDGDGYTTHDEYILGTDPTDPTSRFAVDSERLGNDLQIEVTPWQGGRIYELESSTNCGVAWQTLPIAPATANGRAVFTIPNSGQPGPRLFRVAARLVP